MSEDILPKLIEKTEEEKMSIMITELTEKQEDITFKEFDKILNFMPKDINKLIFSYHEFRCQRCLDCCKLCSFYCYYECLRDLGKLNCCCHTENNREWNKYVKEETEKPNLIIKIEDDNKGLNDNIVI